MHHAAYFFLKNISNCLYFIFIFYFGGYMRKYNVTFFILLTFVCSQNGWAQLPTGHPPGYESVSGVSSTAWAIKYQIVLTYTEKWLHVTQTSTYRDLGEYQSPVEAKILSAAFKANDKETILILLLDVETQGCYIVTMKYQPLKGRYVAENAIIPAINFTNAQKIIGDALYILKQGKVYASWDTAKTWSHDSINISTETINDIAIDTNFYGWVITQNRNLYYQHPDSNIWRKDTSFKTTGIPRAIFVDRKGRMFIYTTASVAQGRVVMSTDGGVSFTNISTGIVDAISSFGDDVFGNIYAVSTGSSAYRLSNLTPPWIPIGDSIKAQAYLPSIEKIINSISGDSILYAATRYGMFQSTDFGTNWVHSPNVLQSRAHNFYTGVVKGGNYYFISTNLGIYRVAAGDTTWGKVFPKQGFVRGINVISSDSAGNVYGNLPIKTGPSSWLFYIVKSTDHGNSWIPDTAGFKALGINAGTQTFDFFVDKQGIQFLGGSGILFSKKPGQPWKRDTAGIGLKSGEYIADVSLNNKKGIIYLGRRAGSFPTYSFAMYRRAIEDSVWHIVNTSVLATSEGRLVSDAEGNIVVRTLSGSYKIWRYDGSTWTQIPLPTGIGSSPFALKIAVDRSGVLWGAFVGSNLNKGVYFTSDNGTTWNYVGLNGVGINFLTAVEDTVYAVTFIDGIYGFTTASKPMSVGDAQPQIAASYELFQNFPNPFNPTTVISYQLPVSSFVTLKVYDVLGREVATLVNEVKEAGNYSVQFDGSKFSSGIYFSRLEFNGKQLMKKLLMVK